MSVEKMEIMNIIGYLSDLDKVSMEIVRHGNVHILNAMNEISENDFTVMTPEQNTDVLRELCFIKQYNRTLDHQNTIDKLNELMEILGMGKSIRRRYIEGPFNYGEITEKTDDIYKEINGYESKIQECRDELKEIMEFQDDMKHIKNVKIDFTVLKRLNFFNFKIGKFSKENYSKLKDNIENISSIIYEISSIPGYQVVICLTPEVLEVEVDRIFKSLNFEEIRIPYDLDGTPVSIIADLGDKISDKKKEIKDLNKELTNLKRKYAGFIDESYSRMKLFEKAQSINSEVACTNEFFYMAGWVPVSEKANLQKRLAAFGERLILVFKPQSQVSRGITPPTRLKNNWFVRPFESIVAMYGTPSYKELDPTSFVAVSYMIMFGSMFGDVGQGFIFVLAGLLLSLKMRRPNLGGILSRIGISSMIFGFLFGSVFGNEELIKPLWLSPMHNINLVLAAGVVLGVIFTTVGFIYSLINAAKRRDLEDGVFGKDGLVGLLFYWIILLTALSLYSNGTAPVPLPAVIAVLCVLLGLMVVKQPIASLLSGHRPLHNEPIGDYYIESGFGVVETLLSMLSNTVSFIRVGAFALNHVGLFVAFTTIADMMKNSAGSVGILILGNIVIIGLEGLIVFIQGLRLEYYELFSKYYRGDGIDFKPVKLYSTNKMANFDLHVNVDINEAQLINM